MNNEYVMYCIFSAEAIKAMGGNRGKLASMAGHAYLHAWWDAAPMYSQNPPMSSGESKGGMAAWVKSFFKKTDAIKYRDSGFAKKVTLVVDTTEQLNALYDSVKDLPFGSTLVVDRGLTVFEGPTTVCVGFGPIEKSKVPEVISSLKVLI